MNRIFLTVITLSALKAQIMVDTVAGGVVRTGVSAQDIALGSVTAVTWSASGNLVFTDSTHDLIRSVRPDGIVETIVGTGVTGYVGDGGPVNSALLDGPRNLQYDAAGNLYIDDSMNSRIRRVDTRGVITTVAGDGIPYNPGMDLEGPAVLRSISVSGIVVDPAGIVYFSDARSGVIRRITQSGQLEIVAGVYSPACSFCSDGDGGPANAAHLNHPGLIAFDAAGNLYMVEVSVNSVIRRISPDGIITKFAGYGAFPANLLPRDGGPALSEYFGSIVGLSADGNGNIYVTHERQPLLMNSAR